MWKDLYKSIYSNTWMYSMPRKQYHNIVFWEWVWTWRWFDEPKSTLDFMVFRFLFLSYLPNLYMGKLLKGKWISMCERMYVISTTNIFNSSNYLYHTNYPFIFFSISFSLFVAVFLFIFPSYFFFCFCCNIFRTMNGIIFIMKPKFA